MQKLLHLASVLPSSSLKNSISQKKNIFPNPHEVAIIIRREYGLYHKNPTQRQNNTDRHQGGTYGFSNLYRK